MPGRKVPLLILKDPPQVEYKSHNADCLQRLADIADATKAALEEDPDYAR